MNLARPDDDATVRVELPHGVALHVIEKGQGPAVVLLHGGMGDCHSWAPQMAALSPRFRVVAYSRRHSSPNRNRALGAAHSVQVDVVDLVALQRALQMAPMHLVATSYGALVALVFALEHPQHVRSLVLAEPPLHHWACRTPRGADLHAAFMRDVWRPAAAAFDLGDPQRALQLLADGIWGRAVFASLPRARVESALRNAGSMHALTQASEPFTRLTRRAVSKLSTPVLLVQGEHASALHRLVVEELARELPAAARAVIEGAGHGSPTESPDAFNRVVEAFLGAQERRLWL